MEYGLPKKPKKAEDTFYSIRFAGTDETYNFSDRWDRICAWQDMGAFCLKIFDNEQGLVEAWIDEEAVQAIIDHTGTEPHYRTTMTPQEEEAFNKSKGRE